jgi:hypothetical protein
MVRGVVRIVSGSLKRRIGARFFCRVTKPASLQVMHPVECPCTDMHRDTAFALDRELQIGNCTPGGPGH